MKISQGTPYPLGATVYKDGIGFAYVSKEADCGVVFFDKKTMQETERVAFPKAYDTGDVHTMHLAGILPAECVYCFYEKDTLVTDVRARVFLGEVLCGNEKIRLAGFVTEDYAWEEDTCPCLSYAQSIIYCMHVKGFSVHVSSKVKAKGTYGGIVEKIPYFKELGITTLELQPAYEFEEKEGEKVNYWGYKRGHYYVPKAGYCLNNPVTEFKDMVKALHKNNLEVIMQFYFTDEISKHEITDILTYWITEYHVDGFHLKGANIDTKMLMREPALAHTKLWYYSFPLQTVDMKVSGRKKRLASYTETYKYDMRRFLKSDEGMVSAAMYYLRHNPEECGQIHFLTNYDGFTLADMVSYNQKHNEANGEKNRDGADYNASWNCGEEGESRKRAVRLLRKKQIKNALMLLFLSQATPLIFMGDEFGNSQQGNNNPYCQDNEVAWLNWKDKEKTAGKEIFAFTKEVIALRKKHPVFCQEKELRLSDYKAVGCPDISYHGEEAYKPDTSAESRQFGILYCGEYGQGSEKVPDDYFYVAYNMHWETKKFALPKLPKGLHWELILTSDESMKNTEDGGAIQSAENTKLSRAVLKDKKSIELPGRSIGVYKSIGERKLVLHESRTAF
ncbi:MAG: hypothetical protein IJX66_01215 [Lachnospiraceae bacterium]|nr:hypothetical protein [Lachnospiraceae bacterium]